MLLEDLIFLILLGTSAYFIGIPLLKAGGQILRNRFPKKVNPLEEAKARLEQAHLEAEAARINKETEKLYDELYAETLEDEESENKGKKHE